MNFPNKIHHTLCSAIIHSSLGMRCAPRLYSHSIHAVEFLTSCSIFLARQISPSTSQPQQNNNNKKVPNAHTCRELIINTEELFHIFFCSYFVFVIFLYIFCDIAGICGSNDLSRCLASPIHTWLTGVIRFHRIEYFIQPR